MDWAITLISSTFGAIILGIVSNLLTDKLKNWLMHKSVTSKYKRLSELQKELSRIKGTYADKQMLYLNVAIIGMYVIVLISLGISGLIGGVLLVILGNTGATIQWLFAAIPIIQLQSSARFIDFAQIQFYLGQWASGAGSLLVVIGVKLALDQARDLAKVRDFGNYAKNVEQQIDEISKSNVIDKRK